MAIAKKGTFVFLRGLGRESGHWAEFLERVKQTFPSMNIVGIDHPGIGTQQDLKAPLNTKAMAQWVLNSVVGEPVYIYGHSLGGMVALEAAFLSPDRVGGIVVCNSSAADVSLTTQRVKMLALKELMQIFFEGSEKKREARVLNLVSRSAEQREHMLPNWIKIAKDRPVKPKVLAAQIWAASRFRLPKLQPFRPPVLILSSLGDELVDPECSVRIAEKLSASHFVHPWAGHELNLDDTEWVLTQVQNWLESLGSKS